MGSKSRSLRLRAAGLQLSMALIFSAMLVGCQTSNTRLQTLPRSTITNWRSSPVSPNRWQWAYHARYPYTYIYRRGRSCLGDPFTSESGPLPEKTTDSTPGLRRPHARHLPRTTLSAYKDSGVPSAPVDQSSTLRRGGQQPWAGAGSDQATLG